jgi:hypothetical protein
MKKSFWILGLGTALVLPVVSFAETEPKVEEPAPIAVGVVEEAAPVEISSKPLTPSSQVKSARLSDLFRVVFAACRADINALKAIANPTPAQSKKLAAKEKEMKDLAVLYDEAVNIAPIVTSVSIQFGAEVPSQLMALIPGVRKLKYGEPGLQFSAGVTLAQVNHELTGKPTYAIGISQLAGVNFTFGHRQRDKLRPRAGVTYLVPAIAITVPLVEDIKSTTIGDLQGIYWGSAGEVSTPAGENGKVSRAGSIGLYAKVEPALKLPEAAMIFIFHGLGGETNPPSAQMEALVYNVWVGSDSSTFRLPVPFVYNNRTSPHSNISQYTAQVANREKVEALNADDLAKKIAEIQAVLEKNPK